VSIAPATGSEVGAGAASCKRFSQPEFEISTIQAIYHVAYNLPRWMQSVLATRDEEILK
jgi:hypothetical protein